MDKLTFSFIGDDNRSLRLDDMKCELLAESNIMLLLDFIDDMNTKYDETMLKAFLDEKNAYGYVLNEPDGRKTFYLHAIDIMVGYQNLGYGTELVRFVHAHSKSLGCRKMFLMTNTGNVSACRCYEKAGGISATADVVMYEYKK